MKHEDHYKLVGVVNDEFVNSFICSGGGDGESFCRPSHSCEIIDFFYNMGDFAAYRMNNDYPYSMISLKGYYDSSNGKFEEASEGESLFEISTRHEFVELLMDSEYVDNIDTSELKVLKLFRLDVDFSAYEETYGGREGGEDFATLWDFAEESELLRPDSESFERLLLLQSDYRSRNAVSKPWLDEVFSKS